MSIDADLERAIDGAGRSAVFARARGYGWRSGDDVPKYVWWEIVRELREANKAGDRRNDPRERLIVPRYHESRDLGFFGELFGGGLFR